MSNIRRQAALITIAPEYLFGILNLPKDAEFVAAMFDFDINCFKVKIRHESLPEVEDGKLLPYVIPKYNTFGEFLKFDTHNE